MIDNNERGLFFPQNAEYSNTSNLVQMIAAAHGKKIHLIKGFGWFLKLTSFFTGLVNKAFGNMCYDLNMSEYRNNYHIYDLKQSVIKTESNK
jgi:UDP-glucose 4-epimerase